MSQFLSADVLRARFAEAMSAMYRDEVPQYATLLDIVASVNAAVMERDPPLRKAMERNGDGWRLGSERHGAIRLGKPEELNALRRVFAVMGMEPVGYYDLSVASVPVHSTAFRPITLEALKVSPFRIFTSLLRLELIEDGSLRERAAEILSNRQILSERAMALTEKAEKEGGLEETDAQAFIDEVLVTFRWHAEANVDLDTYKQLNDAHRLVADVVSFRGPHINHLTPRTLDIDAAQDAMQQAGLDAKAVIEGPPRRAVPILLRQTSFKALEEPIRFRDGASDTAGTHTARFGEIEQRGVALTPKGRALYDACLSEARGAGGDYETQLRIAFARFPDDTETLNSQGLAYFRHDADGRAEPILYEDFLPVSAAGIFQSNLGEGDQATYSAASSQREFEDALGVAVHDPFALYEAIAASRPALFQAGETDEQSRLLN